MVAAILLATAALVLSIIDLTRPAPVATSTSTTTTPDTAAPASDTTATDRALCTAIAPLMAENERFSNAYVDLGNAGTPARDSALPKFITDMKDWIERTQPIFDQHPHVAPFFRRSLQRYIDDQNLLVSGVLPGPLPAYIKALWSDSLGAYAGPLHICYGLGIEW